MAEQGEGSPRPKVFISYAHESDDYREAVRGLADNLAAAGCEMWTDHEYRYRPPAEGWQVWMHGCVTNADIVLVACTPKLKARFEKNAPAGEGLGATFEGAIVTQHLYESSMRNTRFFPIAPDNGRIDDVPVLLRPWWNGHRFPSGIENIRRMILGDDGPDWEGAGASSGPVLPPGHLAMTQKRLAATGAEAFLFALHGNLARGGTDPGEVPCTPAGLVQWMQSPAINQQAILKRFRVIQRTLRDLESHPQGSQHLPADTEKAAAAAYCLAACQLVQTAMVDAGRYVLHVPEAADIIYGIITTAVFGWELRIAGTDEAREPHAPNVRRIRLGAGVQDFGREFERQVFLEVFENTPAADQVAGGAGPLTEQQRHLLAAHLSAEREADDTGHTFVVLDVPSPEPFEEVAGAYNLAVMLPSEMIAGALLHMNPGRLKAEIDVLWSRLRDYRAAVD